MSPTDHLDELPVPILVLGLGNQLLRDDGVGLELLEHLCPDPEESACVELIDGGTQGLALLPYLSGRRAVLVLDAIAKGAEPGTVHIIPDARADRPGRGTTAHESNAGDLIATAELIGQCPDTITVVGIEPGEVRTGIGLSQAVRDAMPEALSAARRRLTELTEDCLCTS